MSDASGTWPTVEPRPDLPRIEEEVLALWRSHDVFGESLRRRAGGPVWTFYEGPPTANGMPGTHHVEARVFKDVFPRYRTMTGHFVRRKGGWDCHGLPVEVEVEKELGLGSKADIEAYGIEAFNARCRESVQRYVDAFEELTERIGFWVDTEDPYWTMDPSYVDSLWWALKELTDRGLVFEEYRVAPYCGRCGTALSDAEVALGYAEIDDPSVTVRFPLRDPLPERARRAVPESLAGATPALAVWTTTPWTLPSNTACALGPEVSYALVASTGTAPDGGDELLILATELVDTVLGTAEDGARHRVLAELTADELAGLRYRAPFRIVEVDVEDRFLVTAGYVTTTEGTGIVHQAPAFGAEDLEVCRRAGLPVVNPVDGEGRFTAGPWKGTFVKDADPDIIDALREGGHLLAAGTYTHVYPFCWRCKRPLIYWAKPSWYIRTTAKRDELLANNAHIDWHPEHIRDGRFGNWLENNVDWALSRDRYWGTPLPFWRCGDCRGVTAVGSRAELSRLAGRDLSQLDPHRPYVDEVTIPCPDCGGEARRVPDVADAWFDSGGMPFAQWGHPHQGREEFERHFPADFICEAIDQTRGWFYSLLAESTLLFGQSSYRTVLCLGHIVDEHGKKMSKSAGNILDPWELIGRHGADPLRWLMFAEGNPWQSRRVGHHLLEDVVRRFLLTLWNTHVFFTTYARIDGFSLDDEAPPVPDRPAADRWALAELAALVDTVGASLEAYDVSTATRALERFVDDLSNWYVRRNRRRFWRAAAEDPADKRAAYHTLHTCLVTLSGLLAPLVPFVADRLWRDLVVSQVPDADPSVHLTRFPAADEAWRDEELRAAMETTRRVVELGRQARNDAAVRIRQPLARALVSVPAGERAGLTALLDQVRDELNVKSVEVSDGTDELVERTLKPNFRALGPALGSRAPRVADRLRDLVPGEAEAVARALDTGRARLAVDDEEVELTPEMVEVVETPRTGWAVASDGATTFALDTELTRDLEVEGAMRELVRAVNDQRKAAGLELTDRIRLDLEVAPADLDEELAGGGWYDALAREVLADDLRRGAVADGAEVDLAGLGSARLRLGS